MPLADNTDFLEELNALGSQEEKFKYLIDAGRELPNLPEDEKIDTYRIEGCVSQLWLVPSINDGKVNFRIDSDAAIPKGIAAILIRLYNDNTPDEILAIDPAILREVGIEQHLSMNRRNGLANLTKQIRLYATAYKVLPQ